MWLFPLYLFLINLFVFPIAMGGLLKGLPVQEADIFVIDLPASFRAEVAFSLRLYRRFLGGSRHDHDQFDDDGNNDHEPSHAACYRMVQRTRFPETLSSYSAGG